MSTRGDRIKQVRKLSGLSQEAFAARLKVSRGAVGNWELNKGITTPNMTMISQEFSVSFDWLANARGTPPEPAVPPELGHAMREDPPAFAPAPPIMLPGKDFPVYASAEGGPGEIIRSTDPVDWVPRPAPVASVRGAYGLLITGESMFPEYQAGETAIVDPNLPVVGAAVYVFYSERDGEARATIKHLRRAAGDAWHVRQWNPPEGAKADFTLGRKEWGKAHRVLGKYSRR